MSATFLSRLPLWVSRWLGYRKQPKAAPGLAVTCLWSFMGAFCSLAVLQAVFGHTRYFISRHTPAVIASFVSRSRSTNSEPQADPQRRQGASAVLCFGSIEAPFAQPRSLIGGHFISALIGVCVTKLFHLSSNYNELSWLAASLSTAIAIVAMQLTKTVHPPAGATALLPSTMAEVFDLSWYFLPVVLLSSVLMLAIALVMNNIQRRYPIFWVAPPAPKPVQQSERSEGNGQCESLGQSKEPHLAKNDV